MRKAYFLGEKFLALVDLPDDKEINVSIRHNGELVGEPNELPVDKETADFIKENKNEVVLDITNNKIIKLTKEEKSPNI